MSSQSVPTPLALRALAPLGAFAVALIGNPWILRQTPGAVSPVMLVLAFLIIVLPFAALAVVREPDRPLLPLRISLNATIAFAVLIILSMPFPPRRETVGSLVMCWGAIVASISIQALMRERPRIAFGALIALAGLGAYAGLAAAIFAMSPTYGATVKDSFGPVAFLAASCIASLWYGRSLRVTNDE